MNDFNPAPSHPETTGEGVADAVHDLKEAAEAKARELGQAAGEKIHEFRNTAERALRDAPAQWKELGDHAMAYVKENPGKAVLAGLGAGFLIGLLFREK